MRGTRWCPVTGMAITSDVVDSLNGRASARAIDGRDPGITSIRTFPFPDPIRNHPRLGVLLQTMNRA